MSKIELDLLSLMNRLQQIEISANTILKEVHSLQSWITERKAEMIKEEYHESNPND